MGATSTIHATLMSLYKIVLWIRMIYVFHGLRFLLPVTLQPDRNFVGIISTLLIRSRGRKSIVNAAVIIAEEDYYKLTHISISSRTVRNDGVPPINIFATNFCQGQMRKDKLCSVSNRNQ